MFEMGCGTPPWARRDGGCALHCAARDLAGSGWGARRSSAWLPLPSHGDSGWLFLLQQGEPTTLDLEKLVSTVAAQKLVLETQAGKVSSPPSRVPPTTLYPPTRAGSHSQGPGCFLLPMVPAPWDGLHPVTSWARTGALAQGTEYHLPCRHASDGEH